jgi:threonine dehydrogenase-like Zn-dependent dehydrogenase
LKSTSGQTLFGVQRWTQLVVEEISILPFSIENLEFSWQTDRKRRRNVNIYVSPSVHSTIVQMAKKLTSKESQYSRTFYQITIDEAVEKLQNSSHELVEKGSPFPKFDLAIISQIEEIDSIIRPLPNQHFSLIRPRGAILLCQNPNNDNMKIAEQWPQHNELWDAIINRKIAIRTTRCGDAKASLTLLEKMPELATKLCQTIFTHEFKLEDINKAFEVAKNSRECVKVLIDTFSCADDHHQ